MRKGSVYVGRLFNGEPVVRVRRADGVGSPLAIRTDIRNHSPTGHAWGYAGSGPAQVALDVLIDHFEIPADTEVAMLNHRATIERACRIYQEFKRVFANISRDQAWQMTSKDVDGIVFSIEAFLPGSWSAALGHAEHAIARAEDADAESRRLREQSAIQVAIPNQPLLAICRELTERRVESHGLPAFLYEAKGALRRVVAEFNLDGDRDLRREQGHGDGVASSADAIARGALWGVWCVNEGAWCSGTVGSEHHAREELPRWVSGKVAEVDPARFRYELRRVTYMPKHQFAGGVCVVCEQRGRVSERESCPGPSWVICDRCNTRTRTGVRLGPSGVRLGIDDEVNMEEVKPKYCGGCGSLLVNPPRDRSDRL